MFSLPTRHEMCKILSNTYLDKQMNDGLSHTEDRSPEPRVSQAWFKGLPKIELHLHLEGAIPLEALWALVQKYGGTGEVPNLEALKARFSYRDFPHFLETWVWKNQFLRSYEDFAFIAESVARRLKDQNILYAEMFYSPGDFWRQNLKVQPITEAVRAGLSRVDGIELALIADMVRNFGPEKGLRTLMEVNEVRGSDVIGIGIGGAEKEYPPELFTGVYKKARELGYHTSAHAGEGAGADSIWGALRRLEAERIGHATRAEEDPALIDFLAGRGVPLEMCPISNVKTGVVAGIADHPIRRYFNRGLMVTVNTDDPGMFGNSLSDEYQLLVEKLGFTYEDIHTLILNGIHSAWLPEDRKAALTARFISDPGWAINAI